MFYIGLDLGQRVDHSAVAVVQRSSAGLHVRHIQRIPLATPYPRVIEIVGDIAQAREITGHCSLAVDATGVGAPVVEMLRQARLPCDLQSVTITSGERARYSTSLLGQSWNVPKQDLLAGLQVLLEKGELKIAKHLKEASSLIREMMDVKTFTSKSGRERIGAEGTGEHDDLVIALCLACWSAARKRNSIGNQRLGMY